MTQQKLTVTKDTFNEMISGLIQSGVGFSAEEWGTTNLIVITFTGGY